MKDRIRKIMESQHMTQQVFAQTIGLSPATLSSIYNGRTNPTLNIVDAIKKKIPNISTDWLMFGQGEMYISAVQPDSTSNASASSETSTPEHLGQVQRMAFEFEPYPDSPQNGFRSPQSDNPPSLNLGGVRNTLSEKLRTEVKQVDKPQRRVIEIRVFYDDQTWETFVPQKK